MRLAVAMVLISIASTARAQDSQRACGLAANADYNRANVALVQKDGPIMALETVIAQRRLEEQFCQRIAHCFYGDEPNGPPYRALFSSCLRDESLAKYDAISKEDQK
jgi:hypothetical protein